MGRHEKEALQAKQKIEEFALKANSSKLTEGPNIKVKMYYHESADHKPKIVLKVDVRDAIANESLHAFVENELEEGKIVAPKERGTRIKMTTGETIQPWDPAPDDYRLIELAKRSKLGHYLDSELEKSRFIGIKSDIELIMLEKIYPSAGLNSGTVPKEFSGSFTISIPVITTKTDQDPNPVATLLNKVGGYMKKIGAADSAAIKAAPSGYEPAALARAGLR